MREEASFGESERAVGYPSGDKVISVAAESLDLEFRR